MNDDDDVVAGTKTDAPANGRPDSRGISLHISIDQDRPMTSTSSRLSALIDVVERVRFHLGLGFPTTSPVKERPARVN